MCTIIGSLCHNARIAAAEFYRYTAHVCTCKHQFAVAKVCFAVTTIFAALRKWENLATAKSSLQQQNCVLFVQNRLCSNKTPSYLCSCKTSSRFVVATGTNGVKASCLLFCSFKYLSCKVREAVLLLLQG